MAIDSAIYREEISALDKMFDLLAEARNMVKDSEALLPSAGVTDTSGYEAHVQTALHALTQLEVRAAWWRCQRTEVLRARGEEV